MPTIQAAGYAVPRAASVDTPDIAPQYQNIPTTADMFGGSIGQALTQFGQQAERASDRLDTIQKQYDDVTAREARNRAEAQAQRLLYGDPDKPEDTGYFGLQGRASLDQRKATLMQLNKFYEDERKNLPTQEAVRRFDEGSSQRRLHNEASVLQHSSQQFQQYRDKEFKAETDLRMNNVAAASTRGNKADFDQSLGEALQATEQGMRARNASQAEIDEKKAELTSTAVTFWATGLLPTDPQTALRAVEENKEHFRDPAKYAELHSRIKAQADKVAGRDLVKSTATGPAPGGGGGFTAPAGPPIAGATPAEQQVLNEIRHRESTNNYKSLGPQGHYGAYQFDDPTWKEAAASTGLGGEYAHASDAPAAVQDANALAHYRKYGTRPWAASGPYPGNVGTVSGGGAERIRGYAAGNAVPDGPSPITGVHPEFADRIANMVDAMPAGLKARFTIISGYRSQERQAQVNPSVTDSHHTSVAEGSGMAVDLGDDPAVLAWVKKNGPQFGVGFPLDADPKERNHLEPLENGQRVPPEQMAAWASQYSRRTAPPQAQAGATAPTILGAPAPAPAVPGAPAPPAAPGAAAPTVAGGAPAVPGATAPAVPGAGGAPSPTAAVGIPDSPLAAQVDRINRSNASPEVKEAAIAELHRQHSATALGQDQAKYELEKAITRGDAAVTPEYIDSLVKGGKIAPAAGTSALDYLAKVQAQKEAEREALRKVNEAGAGGTPLDPKNEYDRKALNYHYEVASSLWPAQQALDRSVAYATQYGLVPDKLKAAIRGGLHSGQPDRAMLAADTVARLRNANPSLVGELGDENDLRLANQINSYTSAGVSPQHALELVTESMKATGAEKEARKDDFEAQRGKTVKERTDNDDRWIARQQNSLWVHDPNVDPTMRQEFVEVSKAEFERTGNLEAARRTALDQINRVWGRSDVGGDRRYMKFAPEKFYPVPGLSPSENTNWMKEQLLGDMATNALQDPDNPITPERIRLLPDPTRSAAGLPVYQVWLVRPDAAWQHVVDAKGAPVLWKPDWNTSAERQRRAAAQQQEVETARQLRQEQIERERAVPY